MGRLFGGKLPGGRALTRHEAGPWSVDAVFRAMDARVARRIEANPAGLSGVYAYEDGAAETFASAGRVGIKRIYDLPIGYWRAGHAIYAEEAEREPQWAPTLTGRDDSAEKLARKDAELAAADTVIVASSFTRQTLEASAGVKSVHVVPYGRAKRHRGRARGRSGRETARPVCGIAGSAQGVVLFARSRRAARERG